MIKTIYQWIFHICRYDVLCGPSDDTYGNVGRCMDILKAVNIEGAQLGKTKVRLQKPLFV